MLTSVVLFMLLMVLVVVIMPRLSDVTYPTSMQLREIEQVLLPQLTEDDPIFEDFPIVEDDKPTLRWEQQDNYTGLQQVRGYNGAPRHVSMVGSKMYEMTPGVYGDYITLDEKEISERRRYGEWDQPIAIDDIVAKAATFLLQRRIDRIRYNIWTLLSYGIFTNTDAAGNIMHTDSFPIQVQNAAVAWGTVATATPSADIRNGQLKYRGQSVDFGVKAKIYANLTAINNVLQNTNANDLFGRRINGGATVNNLEEYNAILAGNGLPTFVIYDKGYINDSGTFTLFIPDTRAVMVGARTNGSKLGEYRMTRNANNPTGQPGAYTKVADWGDLIVPRRIDVHDGHNGGPCLFFPGGVVNFVVG